MVDFINPLDIETIFIDVFAGNVLLFVLLFALLMAILAIKFKMPSLITLAGASLFGMFIYSQAPIFLPVILIIIAINIGVIIAGVVKR